MYPSNIVILDPPNHDRCPYLFDAVMDRKHSGSLITCDVWTRRLAWPLHVTIEMY